MLEELKLLANKNDVPCQSLVKVFLSERIESGLQKHAAPPAEEVGRKLFRDVEAMSHPTCSVVVGDDGKPLIWMDGGNDR